MKKLCISVLLLIFGSVVFSQEESTDNNTSKPFRIELEPSSYIASGWSILGSYGVTDDCNLHIGLYSIASTLPKGLNTKMFKRVTEEDEIRLDFEIALTLRYKIPYNTKGETNPYIGIFYGWESFVHTNYINNEKTNLSNFFITPQIGYEIYIIKEKLYLNPSVRIVYEFNKKTDYHNPLNVLDKGPEIINWLWLPSFSVGVRL